MQNLMFLLRKAEEQGLTVVQKTNLVREYLQVLILRAIYQSKYKRAMSFMGGTCLRICYDLRRFSEDLDFALDQKFAGYSFQELNEFAVRLLKQHGFAVDLHVRDDKIVHKSFLRVSNILPQVDRQLRKNQKLHIKLEVDTRPIPVTAREIETFFVTKFGENFPILKHSNETLFAGKILAILQRVYTKGRDYYDLIWYLKNKVPLDLAYLNRGLKQAGESRQFADGKSALAAVREKVDHVRPEEILADIKHFLADPSESQWIQQYPAAFEQFMAQGIF